MKSGKWLVAVLATSAGLLVGATGSTSHAEATSEITVTALNVTQTNPAACGYTWEATVRNGTTHKVTAQGLQGRASRSWVPAGSTSSATPNAGNMPTYGPLTWKRKANKTQFRVQILAAGNVVAKRTVRLPREPTPKVEFGKYGVGSTTYFVEIENLNAHGLADVVIHGESGPSATGPWTPAGGEVVPCVNGNGTHRRDGHKPADHTHVKIELRRGSTTLIEKVFSQPRRAAFGRLPTKKRKGTTAPGLQVTAVEVTQKDLAKCGYAWTATVRNAGSTTSAADVSIQGSQGNAQDPPNTWGGASGTTLGALNPGATRTKGMNFKRQANKSQFKVRLWKNKALAEKVVALPAQQPARVGFGKTNVSATTYWVDIKNLNAEGLARVIVQGFSGKSASGPWSSAGGQIFDCLTGNGSHRRSGHKPADHTHVKVEIKLGTTVIATKVFTAPQTHKRSRRKVGPTQRRKTN